MSGPLPRKVDRLAAEQGHRCAYCQEPFGSPDNEANPTLDHVVPASRGGKRNDANLVAACARCNHAKGRLDAAEFCAIIDAGRLRQRRNIAAIAASRKAAVAQGRALYLALQAAQEGRRPVIVKAPPRPPIAVGPRNPPHSKNKPLRRRYAVDRTGSVVEWEQLNPEIHDRP